MLRAGEIGFPREKHTNWVSIPMVSPEHTYTSNIIQIEEAVFRYLGINIYINIYIYAC